MALNKPGKRLVASKVIAKADKNTFMQFKRAAAIAKNLSPTKQALKGAAILPSPVGGGVIATHQNDLTGVASLFAKYLERNCIARTTQLISGVQGTIIRTIHINAPTIYGAAISDVFASGGQKVYIYDKCNFNFASLTLREKIYGNTTQFDVNSWTLNGKKDIYNSGSYIVPDFKYQLNLDYTKRLISGYKIPNQTGIYMNFLFTQNTWYSTTAYNIGFGTGTLPATTALNSSVRAFSLSYPTGGALTGANISFMLYRTSTGSLSCNMEFMFCKIEFNDSSSTIGTISKFLQIATIDGTYTENKTYKRPIRFEPETTAGQIVLKEGEGLGVFMRCTNQTSVRVYGSGSFNLKQF
jgi:hypothetical protein